MGAAREKLSEWAGSGIVGTVAYNAAVFGMTARQWRDSNPEADGNIRDAASLHELLVLANLESMNVELVKRGMSRPDRAAYLREMARAQMATLEGSSVIARLESAEGEEKGV